MNFKAAGRCVFGIDVDLAISANRQIDGGCVGDASRLPFRDGAFDVVYADNVLEHLDRPELVFAEVARVLKPGGRFLVKTPNAWHYVTVLARLTPHRFHQWINARRGRHHADTFPTQVPREHSNGARALAATAGLEVASIVSVESRPEYARINPALYLFGRALRARREQRRLGRAVPRRPARRIREATTPVGPLVRAFVIECLPRLPVATSRTLSVSLLALTIAALAWGALAFGAVYPWAYWPLVAACCLAGFGGLVRRNAAPAPAARSSSRWRSPPPPACSRSCRCRRRRSRHVSPAAPGVDRAARTRLRDRRRGRAPGFDSPAAHLDRPRAPRRFFPAPDRKLASLFAGGDVGDRQGAHRARRRAGARRDRPEGAVQRQGSTASGRRRWAASPFGPFVNKNHFAGWMLLALPVTLGLRVRRHLARHARRQAGLARALPVAVVARSERADPPARRVGGDGPRARHDHVALGYRRDGARARADRVVRHEGTRHRPRARRPRAIYLALLALVGHRMGRRRRRSARASRRPTGRTSTGARGPGPTRGTSRRSFR